MIYLDGSALCRFLPGVRHGEAWREWVEAHKGEIVTSQLSLTELRQAAALYPREALDEVSAIVDDVRNAVPLIRFSDDNVTISSHATAVLKPFAALHIGAAVGDKKVNGIATYDPSLAHVAEIYRLKVVTPGLNAKWYLDFEGPVEGWTPVALDAPYDPGGEYAIAPAERRPDAFEKALREVDERAAAAKLEAEAANVVVPLEVAPFGADLDEEAILLETAGTWELSEEGDFVPAPAATETESDEAALAPITDAEQAPEPAIASSEPTEVAQEVVEPPDLVLKEATQDAMSTGGATETPTAALESLPDVATPTMLPIASTPPAVSEPPTQESEASKRRAEMIARLGAYTPKVEAWRDPESAEGLIPATSPQGDAIESTPPTVPITMQTALAAEVVPDTEPTPEPTPELEMPKAPAPEALREPALEPRSAPTPDRAREVVPPAPAPGVRPLAPVGEPVFRPMMEQGTPGATQRDTRSAPIDVPGTPPVPLPLHVEFDDRQSSYSPARIETSGARPLPGSHPFARAGQTEAMTADPVAPQHVPSLEPLTAEPPLPKPLATPFIERPVPVVAAESPADAEEKGSRWRRGKAKDQKKGAKEEAVSTPPNQEEAGGLGWRLDDVLGPGGGKK